MLRILQFQVKETIEIEAKNTIIATGSKPSSLPFITIDKEAYYNFY